MKVVYIFIPFSGAVYDKSEFRQSTVPLLGATALSIDIQHDDTQRIDSQHSNKNTTLSVSVLNITAL
jgi:hypothetical protein